MNRFLHGVARATFESFRLPGPILEVGSFQVAGQEQLAELRGYFPGQRYVGLDMRPGPGVDRLGSVEQLPFEDQSFGTVLALSTFEHVQRFWRGFAEVRRVLRPDGAFLVSCPFHFHIHAYPNDYWRFTPEAFRLLLEDYSRKLIGWHGPVDRPANVWALALGEAFPPITEAQVSDYRARLRRYAREPLSPWRKWRYRLGRWLCGRRPFAPWLLREQWHLDVLVKDDALHVHSRKAEFGSQADSATHDLADRIGMHRQLELQGVAASLSSFADQSTPGRASGSDRGR